MILINQKIGQSQIQYRSRDRGKTTRTTVKIHGISSHACLSRTWAVFWFFFLFLCSLPSIQAQLFTNFDAGPIYDDFPLTLHPGWREEILGPLWSRQSKDSQKEWALHPLFSFTRDESADFSEFDLLYPIFSIDRFGRESRIHFFQLLSFSRGQNQEAQQTRRFTIFPLYFQQRSDDPARNYTMLLPLYGTVKNRLLRDEVRVILWPGYVQSRKRDVVTDNYLYPIFHLRRGIGLRGWQVWPLIGHEHKEPTSRTNQFEEVETIGGHEKWFVLWPFFFQQKTGLGTTNHVWQQALIPFYSLYRSALRDSSTYLWPIFTYTEDREKKYREWGAPWPLISLARGEGKTITRLWPLFGHAANTNLTSKFYLWPVYKFNRLHAPPLDRKRTRILFFLYSDLTEKNLETGRALRRKDFWPFYTFREDFDGQKRWQVLSLVEPLVPNNKSFERNYSPLWSLWRYEKDPKTKRLSQSLLWNLYRRDRSDQTNKYSVLFGLFRYESSPRGKRWRLFYLPALEKPSPGPANIPEETE